MLFTFDFADVSLDFALFLQFDLIRVLRDLAALLTFCLSTALTLVLAAPVTWASCVATVWARLCWRPALAPASAPQSSRPLLASALLQSPACNDLMVSKTDQRERFFSRNWQSIFEL